MFKLGLFIKRTELKRVFNESNMNSLILLLLLLLASSLEHSRTHYLSQCHEIKIKSTFDYVCTLAQILTTDNKLTLTQNNGGSQKSSQL